jgi:hypothetical protein
MLPLGYCTAPRRLFTREALRMGEIRFDGKQSQLEYNEYMCYTNVSLR